MFLFKVFLILYIRAMVRFIINLFSNILKYYKLNNSYNRAIFNIFFIINYFNSLNKQLIKIMNL